MADSGKVAVGGAKAAVMAGRIRTRSSSRKQHEQQQQQLQQQQRQQPKRKSKAVAGGETSSSSSSPDRSATPSSPAKAAKKSSSPDAKSPVATTATTNRNLRKKEESVSEGRLPPSSTSSSKSVNEANGNDNTGPPPPSLLHNQQHNRLRKRKRLNAVLDKISNSLRSNSVDSEKSSGNNNNDHSAEEEDEEEEADNSSAGSSGGFGGLRQRGSLSLDNERFVSNSRKAARVRPRRRVKMFGQSEEALMQQQQQAALQQQQQSECQDLSVRRPTSSAALRREQWRDTQQQSVEEQVTTRTYLHATHSKQGVVSRSGSGESGVSGVVGGLQQAVFKFDSFDRDRYLSGGSSAGGGSGSGGSEQPTPLVVNPHAVSASASSGSTVTPGGITGGHGSSSSSAAAAAAAGGGGVGHLLSASSCEDHDQDIFSPASGRSPHSSLSSPQVSVDSPRICFSPLRIKDSIEEEDGGAAGIVLHNLPKLSVSVSERGDADERTVAAAAAHLHHQVHQQQQQQQSGGGGHPASGYWLDPQQSQQQYQRFLGGGSISRPISPNPGLTPTSSSVSPCAGTPLHSLRHLPVYLTEVYRRRCLSDTDLSSGDPASASHGGGGPHGGHGGHAMHIGAHIGGAVSPRPAGLHGHGYGYGHRGRRAGFQAGVSRSTERAHSKDSPSPSPGLVHPAIGHVVSSSVPHGRYLSLPAKGGSLESEASSTTTQESPLDLSVRSSISSQSGLALKSASAMAGGSMDSIQHTAAAAAAAGGHSARGEGGRASRGKSLGRSPRAIRGSSGGDSLERYSLDCLDPSPLTEEDPATQPGQATAGGGGTAAAAGGEFICPICGQIFALSDRLAKHMASRHKSRSTDGGSGSGGAGAAAAAGAAGSSGAAAGSKAYLCDVCKRSFARSDMLTRHMRLHTGNKPYTCRICGQVFSRSDHLSTHQRTHTGEKPYRCPSCPYAACRRDMITRHMRTHARYELPDGGASLDDPGGGGSTHLRTDSPLSSGLVTSRSVSSESAEPPLTALPREAAAAAPGLEGEGNKPRTPPSPMDTQEDMAARTEAEQQQQQLEAEAPT